MDACSRVYGESHPTFVILSVYGAPLQGSCGDHHRTGSRSVPLHSCRRQNRGWGGRPRVPRADPHRPAARLRLPHTRVAAPGHQRGPLAARTQKVSPVRGGRRIASPKPTESCCHACRNPEACWYASDSSRVAPGGRTSVSARRGQRDGDGRLGGPLTILLLHRSVALATRPLGERAGVISETDRVPAGPDDFPLRSGKGDGGCPHGSRMS
jgi:hypothetical protein